MANIYTSKLNIGDDDLILQDAGLRSRMVAAFQASPDNDHFPSEKLMKDSLDTKLDTSLLGASNGVAELDENGKVPSSQLPSIPDVSTKYDTGDTASTAIADADYIPFYDTSASGRRKTLWSNIKAKLKSYFDTLYLSTHQDISGKADKVRGATDGCLASLNAGGNLVDSLIPETAVTEALGKAHSHSNGSTLSLIPFAPGSAGQVLRMNSNGTAMEFATLSGGGGASDHNFTHTTNQAVSGSVTVEYAANTRGSRMVSASADLSVSFAVNNGSDNYMWVKNTGSSDIEILINSVTWNGNTVTNVYIPDTDIVVKAGHVCEIGIVCNADGAFITSRSDLSL